MQRIGFSGVKDDEDKPVEVIVVGAAGFEINDIRKQGQVTVCIISRDGDDLYEAVADLELPLARAVAAAIVALADWVERADARSLTPP